MSVRAAPVWASRVEVAAVPGGVDARTRVAPRCETFEAHPASRAVVLCGPSAGCRRRSANRVGPSERTKTQIVLSRPPEQHANSIEYRVFTVNIKSLVDYYTASCRTSPRRCRRRGTSGSPSPSPRRCRRPSRAWIQPWDPARRHPRGPLPRRRPRFRDRRRRHP